jgi:hypothetical protein
MTIENYRRGVRKGVTGPETATCFAAAADLVSMTSTISQDTYIAYNRAYWEQVYFGPDSTRTKQTIMRVLNDLGVGTLKGIIGKRAKTPDELTQTLEKLRQGGYRVIVGVKGNHAVGLFPKKDGWQMRSTHIPGDIDRVYRPDELFRFLEQPSGKFAGKPQPNIFAIVAESKQ